MTHTSGPWLRGESVGYHEPIMAGGVTVAHVILTDTYEDEADANARLIAAAPDLLAALKEMLAADGMASHTDTALREMHADGYWPTFIPIILHARAAIAKAEGRGK